MKLNELLQGIHACIFDLDGTLIDSLGIWHEIDIHFFEIHNRPVPKDYNKRIAHMNFRDIAVFTKQEYGFDESVEEIMKIWDDWARSAYENELPAKPGAAELLKELKKRNIPVSLATSNRKEFYEPCLKRLGMSQYFDHCMNVNDINSTKAEPKIYLTLAEMMNSKPENTMVFEDILMAINTVRNASFHTTAIYDRINEKDIDEIKKKADFFITDYRDLVF